MVYMGSVGASPVAFRDRSLSKELEELTIQQEQFLNETQESERWAHIFQNMDDEDCDETGGESDREEDQAVAFTLHQEGMSPSSSTADMTAGKLRFFYEAQQSEDLSDLLQIQRLDSSEVLYEKVRKPPKIIGRFLFGDQIGEGSYGKVKECLDSDNLSRRAVKILKLDKLRRRIPFGVENVRREIQLLRKLRHRNVIQLVEVMEKKDKHKLYMVMDFCVGSMQEMLDGAEGKRLPIWQAHKYFVQLVDGLGYLHSRGVVHKDIKPGNLLFGMDETLKISDLGVAEEISIYEELDICSVGQGTPKFQPPEIACGKYDSFRGFPVDWWASGVTLYNMVSGEYPFEGQGQALLKLYDEITHGELKMPKSVEVDALLESFLRGLLMKNPEERFAERSVRIHEWFVKKHPYSFIDGVPLPRFKERRGYESYDLSFLPYLEEIYLGRTEQIASDSPEEKTLLSARELRQMDYLSPGGSQGPNGAALRAVESEGTVTGAKVKEKKQGPLGKARKKFSSCKVS